MHKNTVIALGLLTMATLGLTTADANVQLVLNESTPLGIVGDTTYDLDNNTIEITLDRPLLCNQATGYSGTSTTKLKLYDPNNEMKGGFTDGLYFAADADYVVQNGYLILNTHDSSKAYCISGEEGNFDLIFKDPFESVPASTPHIQYVGLPNIVAPGQVLEYEIHVNNPGVSNIYFDLLEYWQKNSGHAAYISGTDSRSCNQSGSVLCNVTDQNTGMLRGVTVFPGATLILDVTQTVDAYSAEGSELEFMAAAFLTDAPNGSFLPRQVSQDFYERDLHLVNQSVRVQANTPPQIQWETAPGGLVSFYEDETDSQVFEFSFFDTETLDPTDFDVSVTYSQGGIVSAVLGPLQSNNAEGSHTLTVTPLPNAFTSVSPEQITVTVTDAAAGEASLSIDVEVLPVNDAPSFAMNCSELTIKEQQPSGMTCTSPITQNGQNGTQGVWDDEFIIADFNPGPNESHQSVLDYEINVVDDGGILDMGGNGDPVWISPTTGEISVVTLTGQYGTAEVEILVRDDGGTTGGDGCGALPTNPEHGCDVSDWKTLNIVSQPFKYSISGNVNGLAAGDIKLNLTGLENGASVDVDTEYTTSSDPYGFTLKNGSGQPQLLDNGSTYTVTVKTVQNGYSCSVTNGTGTISGSNITNVDVNCSQ